MSHDISQNKLLKSFHGIIKFSLTCLEHRSSSHLAELTAAWFKVNGATS